MSHQQYKNYLEALNHPGSPVLFLDLDAFENNITWALQSSGNKKIRLATKSIRSREIISRILETNSRFQGLMTYDLREALWLRSQGFTDILMGYPTFEKNSIAELAENPNQITLMVDLPEHIRLLQSFGMRTAKVFNVCIDIDLSMDLPFLRFGVFRSAINDVSKLKMLLEEIKKSSQVRLVGIMGYEAQIAGVGDKNSMLIQLLKKMSNSQLRKRRTELFETLKEAKFNLNIVNGGGTGSLHLTSRESVVTEVTVGSGFYAPTLFDHYESFKLQPALMYTLPVIRHPTEKIFTCLGGGFNASGSIENNKSPQPYLPSGLRLLKHEGAGEVQTPFYIKPDSNLELGSSIIMRHAKSGEICERFEEIVLVRKNRIEKKVKTYRGEGKTFI
jgi:D-serine deaminase-like pyridoxal phosphate-dependent protein